MTYASPVACLVAVLIAGSGAVDAQVSCTTPWRAVTGLAYPSNPTTLTATVMASTLWDPDGAGPATAVLVIGGTFSIVGTVLANNIASYDPVSETWSTLGAGVDGFVYTMATAANGDLLVGGTFQTASGLPASCVARWNGTSWSSLGAGVGHATAPSVASLAVLANGDIVAGGRFTSAGAATVHNIARWNGSAWGPMGTWNGSHIAAMRMRANGDLIVGGSFQMAGGVAAANIACWDGLSWSPLGAGVQGAVGCLGSLPNGDVLASGLFTTAGGVSANRIAAWDGVAWRPLGSGLGGTNFPMAYAMAVLANGDLCVGGDFTTAGGSPATHLARWDGTSWSAMSTASAGPQVYAMSLLPGDVLVAGGQWSFLVQWDGTSWSSLAGGVNGSVLATCSLPDGSIAVGGAFTAIDGIHANRIVKWDGNTWTPFGIGMDNMVNRIATMPSGQMIACGAFSTAGGVAANRIARWDGTAWHALGTGVNGSIDGVAALPNGDVVVVGWFHTAGSTTVNHVARWDGASWTALGSGTDNVVHAVAAMPNGDIVIGGSFWTAGGVQARCLARWNGTAWSAMAPQLTGSNPSVGVLHTLATGELVVGGNDFWLNGVFGSQNLVRWNGTNWSGYGSGVTGAVRAIATMAGGDLVVGGQFTTIGGVSANRIARWNGTNWSAIGSGAGQSVNALSRLSNGDLLAGGAFLQMGGQVAPFLARLTTTCPATAQTHGSGCVGGGGPLSLEADGLPWQGTTFRAVCTGLAPGSLAVGVYAFSQVAIPLAAVHPQGVPGCMLLVDDDILLQFLVSAPTVQTAIAIPTTTQLIGASFHHQVVPVETSAAGHVTAITSSNALTLTVGVF